MATVTYDNNKNYQSLINDAVSSGDMRAAAQFEQLRNEKIAGEGITNYQTTNNYSSYLPTASDTDGTSSQAASGSGSTSAVATTYIDPSGNTQTGYFINGQTYKDPYGNQRIESGSMVDTAGGVYQMTDMGSLKIGESGTLTAYLNSGKYTPAASDAGGSAAYSYQNPYSYSSYDDFYSKNGYGSLTTAQQAAVDAYVQQALNSIESQKKTVNEDADEMARQAYISYMQSKNALPQQLGAAGYNGGMADSQLLALETGLQNNQNDIAKNRASSLYSLDSAATDAKLQGSIQAAQQQAAVAEAAINAWNNYTTQASQTANSDYWNQRNYDYQTSRDAVNDLLTQKNTDYQVSRDTASDSQWDTSTAYTTAMALMQAGVLPETNLLTSAGITEQEAQAYVDAVKTQQAATASKASTYSYGSGTSGTGTTNTTLDAAVEAFNSGDYSQSVIDTLLGAGYTMDDLTAAGYSTVSPMTDAEFNSFLNSFGRQYASSSASDVAAAIYSMYASGRLTDAQYARVASIFGM